MKSLPLPSQVPRGEWKGQCCWSPERAGNSRRRASRSEWLLWETARTAARPRVRWGIRHPDLPFFPPSNLPLALPIWQTQPTAGKWKRFSDTLCRCQLQIGTYQEHCQWLNNKGICHLPLQRLNPMLLIAVGLQQSLREFRVEWGTLCSRESGGTGLWIVGCF